MIVDRQKDLFKGDTGEYVSLSKVESFIRLSPHVGHANRTLRSKSASPPRSGRSWYG